MNPSVNFALCGIFRDWFGKVPPSLMVVDSVRDREREGGRERERVREVGRVERGKLLFVYSLTHTFTPLGAMALSKPRLEIVEQPKSVSKLLEFGNNPNYLYLHLMRACNYNTHVRGKCIHVHV